MTPTVVAAENEAWVELLKAATDSKLFKTSMLGGQVCNQPFLNALRVQMKEYVTRARHVAQTNLFPSRRLARNTPCVPAPASSMYTSSVVVR